MNTDRSFIILNTVDSTNNYAMGIIDDGLAEHGLTVMALEQTEGKGRQGKKWLSQPGENGMFSIIISAGELLIHEQFKLVAAIALCCAEFIKPFLPNKTTVKIKWPNDIYINDRKAGGVLIETRVLGIKYGWAVAGIGINVNQKEFSDELKQKATSLQIETGQQYNPVELVKDLSKKIISQVSVLPSTSFDELMSAYNNLLYKKDHLVKLKKGAMVFETFIKSVDSSGNLITTDVFERSFAVNEVSWH